MERTLIIFKPESIRRGVVHKLLKIWETKGYELIAMEFQKPSKEKMELHYDEHKDKPFFQGLVQRMISGPIILCVFQGRGSIKWSRERLGATDPVNATPFSIRGTFATSSSENMVHASDSETSAEREINIWFPNLGKDQD